MKKKFASLILLVISLINTYFGEADMYTGKAFQLSVFQFSNAGDLYISRPEATGGITNGERVLYAVDLKNKKIEHVISVRNQNSCIMLCQQGLIYKRPKALASGLTYGKAQWYIADFDEKCNKVSSATKLVQNGKEGARTQSYFVVDKKIFYLSIDQNGGTLYRVLDEGLEAVGAANSIVNYDSIIILENDADNELLYYDTKTEMVKKINCRVNQFENVILLREYLCFTEHNEVYAYDLDRNSLITVGNYDTMRLGLFSDDDKLYVYDRESGYLYGYSYKHELTCTSIWEIQVDGICTDYVVYDEMFVYYEGISKEIRIHDLNNETEDMVLLY